MNAMSMKVDMVNIAVTNEENTVANRKIVCLVILSSLATLAGCAHLGAPGKMEYPKAEPKVEKALDESNELISIFVKSVKTALANLNKIS